MILWLAIAGLTALTVAFLVVPLTASRRATESEREEYDLVVYKDQLAEIDRDLERGVLKPDQAESARTEIQRRMLAAADGVTAKAGGVTAAKPASTLPKIAAFAVAILVPMAALMLYFAEGSPQLPDLPFAQRQLDRMDMPRDQAERMIALVEDLAAKMREKPDDAEGWLMLGRSYVALSRYDDAAQSFRKAIRAGGGNAETFSALGEALTVAGQGVLSAEARAAFGQSLSLDPREPRARYYAGMAQLQDGNSQAAIAMWKHLEADSAPEAPWLPTLRGRIAAVAESTGLDVAAIAPQTPSFASAGQPTEGGNAMAQFDGDQREMIDGMVANLAAKLEDNPDDGEGWKKLARAYGVMGRSDEANAALVKAMALLPKDIEIRISYAQALLEKAPQGGALPDDFIAVMQNINAIDPTQGDALYFLGEAARQKGKADEARAFWQKLAAQLPENSPQRADIQAQIEQLSP